MKFKKFAEICVAPQTKEKILKNTPKIQVCAHTQKGLSNRFWSCFLSLNHTDKNTLPDYFVYMNNIDQDTTLHECTCTIQSMPW